MKYHLRLSSLLMLVIIYARVPISEGTYKYYHVSRNI